MKHTLFTYLKHCIETNILGWVPISACVWLNHWLKNLCYNTRVKRSCLCGTFVELICFCEWSKALYEPSFLIDNIHVILYSFWSMQHFRMFIYWLEMKAFSVIGQIEMVSSTGVLCIYFVFRWWEFSCVSNPICCIQKT